METADMMDIGAMLTEVNKRIFAGVPFAEAEQRDICAALLRARSDAATVRRYHRAVHAPTDGRRLYPLFFIPPYNGGKKIRLITGQLPKTQLLSANHYELEILRLLALWDGENPEVADMLTQTVKRLDSTCFAHFCPTGECVGAGVAALRFLSVLGEKYAVGAAWIKELLDGLIAQYNGGHAGMAATNNGVPVFYLYAALPQVGRALPEITHMLPEVGRALPDATHAAGDICRTLLEERQEWLVHMLTRGSVTGPAIQDTYNVTLLYILRNALALLPGYAFMRDRPVVISEKDNRCSCSCDLLA